jgi:hypothetical protein
LWPASVVVSLLLLAAIPPLTAETPSDAERLQKLEQAVSQLQKRNAELESARPISIIPSESEL